MTVELKPLLGTTLILVAHPDDEAIAFGALMQQMRRAVVVFATDGAPRDERFWQQYGSRQAYAQVRRREACATLGLVGAEPVYLVDRVKGGVADQELFRNLPAAIEVCRQIVDDLRPEALSTLAYEGGHPDHDAICFIASTLAREAGLPVWEAPLYHRNQDGACVFQQFHRPAGGEVRLQVEGAVLENKTAMFRAYASQESVLDDFHAETETVRPLAGYDFSRPPLPWKLNYEHWGWPMTGEAVAGEFRNYLEGHENDKNLVIG
ncbi:MAG TPA: PIG-L family deacetylase [Candidatus Angelobacter sp.]